MTLNMKNYKGYEKKPYCNAHYPTLKYTQSADTPEGSRLKKNTDNMSKAKYQEGFQQMKGTKTSVADDAAMLQLQQAQNNQSLSKYHEQFKTEIIGTKTSVADDINEEQLKKIQDMQSKSKYQADFKNDIIGSKVSVADDKTSQFMSEIKDQTSLNKYHEDFKKNIVGTKITTADDVMSAYLKDTTSKITKIGYKDGSRPNSMALSESSIVLEEEVVAAPSPVPTADVITDVANDSNGIEGTRQVSCSPNIAEMEKYLKDVVNDDENVFSPGNRISSISPNRISSCSPTHYRLSDRSEERLYSGSPAVGVSIHDMKKVRKVMESINVFRTTVSQSTLEKMINQGLQSEGLRSPTMQLSEGL